MSKKTITLYVLAGFLVLLSFIAVRTPADLVLYNIAKRSSLISVQNVSGSLWHGKASNININ